MNYEEPKKPPLRLHIINIDFESILKCQLDKNYHVPLQIKNKGSL